MPHKILCVINNRFQTPKRRSVSLFPASILDVSSDPSMRTSLQLFVLAFNFELEHANKTHNE